jgi:hypothetical protein
MRAAYRPSQALNARAMLEYASSIEPRNSERCTTPLRTVVYNELRKLSTLTASRL